MSQESLDSYSTQGAASYSEADAPAWPPVGEQLRAEREARGLSIEDVAVALKLSPRQVDALETGDWASLPGATIIRGFVRNYARLLRLDPEHLMMQLDAAQLPQRAHLDISAGTSAALPQPGRPARRDTATVFSGIFLVVLAVLAYFFVPDDFWQSNIAALRSESPTPEATAEKADAPQASAPAASPGDAAPAVPAEAVSPNTAAPATPSTGTAGDQPSAPAQPGTSAAPAPTSTQAASPAAATASPAAAAGAGKLATSLHFEFARPSWVEIRDGSGRVLISQLNQPGSREFEGQPPFALVIGNASHVALRYKGEVVPLSQRSKEDVARITLE